MAETNSVASRIKQIFPDVFLEYQSFRDQETIIVKRDRIKELMTFLRDEPGLEFRYLADLTAVDYLQKRPRFMIVYHLYSHKEKRILRIKVPLEEEDPYIDSVTSIWSTANWHERECFDLFGIRFVGHPDLRRILLPSDLEGHPLRKDYPVEGR
nr:NADH-quinone oxidoreductase subunit C [Desulfobacterales bacterium]